MQPPWPPGCLLPAENATLALNRLAHSCGTSLWKVSPHNMKPVPSASKGRAVVQTPGEVHLSSTHVEKGPSRSWRVFLLFFFVPPTPSAAFLGIPSRSGRSAHASRFKVSEAENGSSTDPLPQKNPQETIKRTQRRQGDARGGQSQRPFGSRGTRQQQPQAGPTR